MKIKVINKENKLVILKDDEIIFPYGYMTYLDKENDYKSFSKIGFNLFLPCIYIGDHGVNEASGIEPFKDGVFENEGEFNTKVIDDSINEILNINKTANIILRINLNAPSWWRKLNPDEVVKLSDDTTYMQSLSSEKWLDFAKDSLGKIINYINKQSYSNNIIGYHLAAQNTEEWIAMRKGFGLVDKSKSFMTFYHQELKEKYININKLNEIYKTNYLSFDEIEIPNFDSYTSWDKEIIFNEDEYIDHIDYLTIINKMPLLAIKSLVAYTKSIVKDSALIGVFYGYIGQLNATYGHLFINELIKDNNIDFFASPVSYNNARQGAYDFFYHSIMNDAYNNNKLWFIENDIRTYRSRLLTDSHQELTKTESAKKHMSNNVWLGPKSKEESLSVLNRSFAKCLSTNQPYWWFDMWGDFYRDINMLDLFKKGLEINKSFVSQNNNEIAVILDECASLTTNELRFYNMSYSFLSELGFIGTSYDIYSIHTDKNNLKKYKALIYILPSHKQRLLNNLDDEQANFIVGKNIYKFKNKVKVEELILALKQEGVHLYSEGNIIYNASNLISITSTGDKYVEVNFKNQVNLVNIFNENERYFTNQLTLKMKNNETKTFYITEE